MQITQSENNTPQLSLTIKASIDVVWGALREKERLAQWFGWDYEGLEAEIDDIYFTNVREEGGADTARRSLAVNGGDTFILTAQDNRTELQLVRRPLDGTAEDNYYETITEGWVSFIEQLRFMLEHTPKASRKTTFTNLSLERSRVLAQLNLVEEKVGTHFEGQFQDDEIAGSVWFSTSNQLGLMIEGWGPGLLILQFSENVSITTRYN